MSEDPTSGTGNGDVSPPDRWIDELEKNLDRTVIAVPLFEAMRQYKGDPKRPYDVIIDLRLNYAEGREQAKIAVAGLLGELQIGEGLSRASVYTPQYYFATLTAHQIRKLARFDNRDGLEKRAIYKIWLDHSINPLLTESVKTIKADAARVAFAAAGADVVWAVVDSGIDGSHPHFTRHKNLSLPTQEIGDQKKSHLEHQDFTKEQQGPLTDPYGHGTHVAGIIAGELDKADIKSDAMLPDEDQVYRDDALPEGLRAYVRELDADEEVTTRKHKIDRISGVAPLCKLVSLRVLDDRGQGSVSNIIEALGYIQTINEHGRWLHIHGVNLSVGYDYRAEWFACGQSPLCVEVDRLVRSGVVVVVAAGNTGYGFAHSKEKGSVPAGLDLTINDPGNAELAITVGSTHREQPHIYGVSYFSSKGPTGDGRLKPDLVAPGEKVISAATGKNVEKLAGKIGDEETFYYAEGSGTSMAAPHVSGAIASFLSIRREFQGQPQRVKQIFLDNATDLGREKYFQGQGLVDLMRAIQSV